MSVSGCSQHCSSLNFVIFFTSSLFFKQIDFTIHLKYAHCAHKDLAAPLSQSSPHGEERLVQLASPTCSCSSQEGFPGVTSGHHTVPIVAPDVGIQLSIELYIYFYKYVGFFPFCAWSLNCKTARGVIIEGGAALTQNNLEALLLSSLKAPPARSLGLSLRHTAPALTDCLQLFLACTELHHPAKKDSSYLYQPTSCCCQGWLGCGLPLKHTAAVVCYFLTPGFVSVPHRSIFLLLGQFHSIPGHLLLLTRRLRGGAGCIPQPGAVPPGEESRGRRKQLSPH